MFIWEHKHHQNSWKHSIFISVEISISQGDLFFFAVGAGVRMSQNESKDETEKSSEAAEKPAEGEKVKSETVEKPEEEEEEGDGGETKEASAADGKDILHICNWC